MAHRSKIEQVFPSLQSMIANTQGKVKVFYPFQSFQIFVALLITCAQSAYTQGPYGPAGDTNWVMVRSMTDEFNDSIIDPRKWAWAPPWGTCHGQLESSQACLGKSPLNRREEGGSLKLIATDSASTCATWDGKKIEKPYTVGALYSNDTIRYGYFEIRMRIPACDSLQTSGFSPNFWMWHLLPYRDQVWSEIDIYEIDGFDNTVTNNLHYESPAMKEHWALRSWEGTYDLTGLDLTEWHTFACEWSEYQLNFYHNGEVVLCTDQFCDDLKYMNFVVDINVPAVNFGYTAVPDSAAFPYIYEIDYIRTWQYRP